jgi:O-acetyl-ADP-ribose deacetylase (regulator of RNase III)
MPSFKVGNVRLEPRQADITLLEVDAVVQASGTSPVDWQIQLTPWVLSADAGSFVSAALARHAPLQLGQVIITAAGSLNAKYLLSAVVIDWANQHSAKQIVNDAVVENAAKKCIHIVSALGLKSIAFTPWGTRATGVDPAHVTAIMLSAIVNELDEESGELEVVYLVSNSPNHYQWFVDRCAIFEMVHRQFSQLRQEVFNLDVATDKKAHILSILKSVSRNLNLIVNGDMISIGDIIDSAGTAIGKQAHADVNRETQE